MMRALTLLLFLLECSFAAFAQEYPVKDFIEAPVPQKNSVEWRKLVTRGGSFAAAYNGELQIKQWKEVIEHEYPLPDGKLVAFNYGEFGGSLTFIPNDESDRPLIAVNGTSVRSLIRMPGFKKDTAYAQLMFGNFSRVFLYRNELYAIEGLAHRGFNNGALYKLEKNKMKFKVTKVFDFDSAPTAVGIYKDKLYVPTWKSFYVFTGSSAEKLFEGVFGDGNWPNSIAFKNERDIFVGTRAGYVQLDAVSKTSKSYIYAP